MTMEMNDISLGSAEAIAEAESWQERAVQYIAANVQQTAYDVVAKILESDYLYGVDNVAYRVASSVGSKSENVWIVYEHIAEGQTKQVYLTEDGKLRYDLLSRPYWENGVRFRCYTPGEYGESAMESVAIYANLVGIVEEDDFREKYIAFFSE